MMQITTLNQTHYEEEPRDLGFDPAPRRSAPALQRNKLPCNVKFVTYHTCSLNWTTLKITKYFCDATRPFGDDFMVRPEVMPIYVSLDQAKAE